MENSNKKLYLNTILFICFALLLSLSIGCSRKINDQESQEADPTAVVAVVPEPEVDDANVKTESTEIDDNKAATPYTYSQTADMERNDNKIVIDATAESFKNLDADKNDIIDREEFYDGLLVLMDVDKNNVISEEEFEKDTYFLNIHANPQLHSFSVWDTDANKEISAEELREKISSIIDVPSGETLAQNLYIIFDTDNDDKVEKLELDNVVIVFDADSN